MSNDVRHLLAIVGLMGATLVPICGWLLMGSPTRSQKWARIALIALATCYPLGKGCQQLLWGPRIVRFYLSDVGFIPAVTMFGMLVWPYSLWRKRLQLGHLAITGWAVAMAVELLTLQVQPAQPNIPFSARGDWIDVAIFCIVLPVTIVLIVRACDPPSVTKGMPPKLKRRPPNRRH